MQHLPKEICTEPDWSCQKTAQNHISPIPVFTDKALTYSLFVSNKCTTKASWWCKVL